MNRRQKTILGFTIVTVLAVAPGFQRGAQAQALESHDVLIPPVVANDNRRPAGALDQGVLTLALRAAAGQFRPEGDSGRALRVEAFGEGQSPLSSPAPLIRVPEGTEIRAAIRNELADVLRVNGLCDRGAPTCAPIDVPAGAMREVRFKSGPVGTYHYWATTTGMPMPFRASDDSQLSGAFIVDAAGAPADADRVFVITEWTSLTRAQLMDLVKADDPTPAFYKLKPEVLFLINGRTWPHTERLAYDLADRIHWRVVNLSSQVHPMHLHGFYFDVDSLGNGARDTIYPAGQKSRVVTQLVSPGSTMSMTWKAERAGNWLFHCHMMVHVSPTLWVDGSAKSNQSEHAAHDASAGMSGMVVGVKVRGPADSSNGGEVHEAPARRLTLQMQAEPNRFEGAPAYGFVLTDPSVTSSAPAPVPVPGPTLVLERGQPVEITLVNKLPAATAIHWHGMELESYYDGVHGWSGAGTRVTPMIEPGGSFVVRFTPPQTGTFMYHTHLHDKIQLTSGLYGAMLVVEPGQTYAEATDHVLVVGRGGPAMEAPTVLNGEHNPTFVWKAGTRHRVRLINITPSDVFSMSLQTGDGPMIWRPITKDGAPVPPDRCQPGSAKQLIGVGETYDFEFDTPPGRAVFWIDVRTPSGKWEAQGRVIVR
jgi:manganese oxidase